MASGVSSTQRECLCGPEERLKRVLMVRRLHPAVTMQMLLQTFGAFGSVTGCKVFTHKSGRSAGCASLEFSTHQAACAALKGLQGTLLHGKHVMLQWFDQSLSSATSPVGRGPGQRSELAGGALSDGGTCAAIAARQLSSAGGAAGPVRSAAASCPGLSPFGMFAAAPPGNPFCNSTAAMAAAAAAAAAVAAQQQQLQHPSDAAATAAALLSGQHSLPPLVVQQLQRQVSTPLGAFGQLSPTGAHIPPSPLTPGSHGGGWEALMSPAGHPRAQQQRSASMSSRSGAGCDQQGWGAAAHSPAHLAAAEAAATLSAAMSTGSIGSSAQDNLSVAASLQQLASMQHQALAYAAWQNSQQAAAALLQQQFPGQLPTSPMLGSQASAQQAQMHLLGARSMPSELGNSLSAEFFLQQATASLQAQQQQQQQAVDSSEGGSRGPRSSAGAPGSLSRQHSTPVGTGLLSADISGRHAVLQHAASNSAGGADSIPAAGAGNSLDQAPGGVRVRSPGSARRKSTGALGGGVDGLEGKSGVEGQHTAKKHLQWEDQRQSAGDRRGAADSGEGGGSPAAGVKGASSGTEGGRMSGRSSSHQLMSPLRGYSGSDDTANVSPDVNALASAHAAAAAAAAVSSCYLSSPTWLGSQRQGLSASQVTPELLANLQGPSLAAGGLNSSQGLQRSPSAAALPQHQQQHALLLAAAAASGSPSSSGAFASSFSTQQQQQQLRRSPAAASSREQLTRISDSQVLAGRSGAGGGSHNSSGNYAQPGMLFSSPSLPGPSAVAAALDAMSVSAAMASAQGWQQQQQQMGVQAAAAEVPASEAFKSKHRMHLQLPIDGATAASKAGMSGAAGERLDQLITTEVLPESPAPHHQQAAVHSPFGAAGTVPGGPVDTGSAWADWSASMAALLSPAHVSTLASRRFEDLVTLQHGMAQEAAAAQGQAARMQQQQPQQGMSAVEAAAGTGKLGSTSSQAAWLLQQSRSDQQQQQQQSSFAPAASRPGSLLTSAGNDVFAPAAAGDSMSEGGAGTLLGKTRHNSLCLDSLSRPGLLTLSHMFNEAAAQQGPVRPSPRGFRANSPQQQQQQQAAAARHALAGEAAEGAASGGFGSFSFQPPVLRSLQTSALSAGSNSSTSSNLMICQPFQLPDFFSRESRVSCPNGSVSNPSAATAAAGGAAASGRDTEGVASPLHPSGIQHQFSENLNGLCIAEESFSGALEGTDRAPGSPVGARHLQHSFSMPARFSAPGGAADALAAAAAAAVAAGAAGAQQQQQEEGQQQGERAGQAPYGDVFKTIWGPNTGSAKSLRG